VANQFEVCNGLYAVLRNDEYRDSPWPATMEVPVGRAAVHAQDSRDDCLKYIEATWADIQPRLSQT
jgi:MbtH protein